MVSHPVISCTTIIIRECSGKIGATIHDYDIVVAAGLWFVAAGHLHNCEEVIPAGFPKTIEVVVPLWWSQHHPHLPRHPVVGELASSLVVGI